MQRATFNVVLFLSGRNIFHANALTLRHRQRIMSSATGSNSLVQGAAGVTTDDQTNADERRRQGEFVRGVSSVRNWLGDPNYPAEKGRYHLYVAYNCPWCHRVLLGRSLMGLQDTISVDVCFPNRSSEDEPLGPNLWKFEPNGQEGANKRFVKFDACTTDTVNGKKYVKEIYQLSGVDDQKSVPILFDKSTKTIVNNESAEILRMFNRFDDATIDMYPELHQNEIDAINDWVYKEIANGAYKAGFSSNQQAYEAAYDTFFEALDKVDAILESNKFLVGDTVTEADVRLFPTLFRFDPVYYTRFKLCKKPLWYYRNIWRWMNDMMKLAGMDEVSNAEYLAHCKQGYFGRTGNGTVPVGPEEYPECYKEPHWTHKLQK